MQTITSPKGEKMVVLPQAEYDALVEALEAARHASTMAQVVSGAVETLTADEALAFAQAVTPLSFWRRKRGLGQKALADLTGISQSYVADLEAGRRKGSVALFLRLSKALNVTIEDLVDD